MSSSSSLAAPLPPAAPLSHTTQPAPHCDLTYKRCLNFWGLNMRLFFLRRDPALRLLGNRLPFYRLLLRVNASVENPERFELAMANALRLEPCAASVEALPVTAARLFRRHDDALTGNVSLSQTAQDEVKKTKKTTRKTQRQATQRVLTTTTTAPLTRFAENGFVEPFCFIWFEIDRCVARESHQFVREHFCLDMRRREYIADLVEAYGATHPKVLAIQRTADEQLMALNLNESTKAPPFGFTHKRFASQRRTVSNPFTNIPADKVLSVLKKQKKSIRLLTLTLNPDFVDAYWTERDYW